MSPWFPAIIGAIVGFVGLAIQAALGFFFLGKMRAEVTAMDVKITEFRSQVDRLEALANGMTSMSDVTRNRVDRLEKDAAAIDNLVRDLATFQGAQNVHNANIAKSLEQVSREMSGVQRQLGNLVTMKRAGTSFEQGPLDA